MSNNGKALPCKQNEGGVLNDIIMFCLLILINWITKNEKIEDENEEIFYKIQKNFFIYLNYYLIKNHKKIVKK